MPKKKDSEKKNDRTRANGEGSFRIRGYSVQFRWEDKSVTEPLAGRNDKTLREHLLELTHKPSGFKPRETIPEVGREWYKTLDTEVEKGRLEESTAAGYEYTLAIIEREYEGVAFTAASPQRLYAGFDHMRKTVRRKDPASGEFTFTEEPYDVDTLRKVRTMLGQIYSYGVFTKRIRPDENPMPYVPKIKTTERRRPEKKAYTEGEMVHLYNELEKTSTGYAIRLCLARGYRGQELVMLTPDDIAEDGSTINIDKALKRGKKGRLYPGNTKSEASDREDYLPSFARPWAIYLREHAKNGYILCGNRGVRLSVKAWRARYYKAIRAAGIEPLTPHKMRHTSTTTMRVRAGISGKVVMAINGQSDERTMEGYDHVDMDAKRKAAQQLDRYTKSVLKKAEKKKEQSLAKASGQRLDNISKKPNI